MLTRREFTRLAMAGAASQVVSPLLAQVGDHKIASPEDVLDAIFYITAEDDLRLRVARGGKEIEFQAHPIDPPEANHPKLPSIGSIEEPTPAPLKIGGN